EISCLPRIPCRQEPDRRPVERLASPGDQRQQPVVQQASEWHRHAQTLRRRESETDVLESERRGEPSGLESLVRDQAAVGLVDWRSEERRGEQLQIAVPVDSGLADQRHGFAERLDRCPEQEVPAELDQVRDRSLFAEAECPLSDRPEEW